MAQVLLLLASSIAACVGVAWILVRQVASEVKERMEAFQKEREADFQHFVTEQKERDAERGGQWQAFMQAQTTAGIQAAETRGAMGERVASLERQIGEMSRDIKHLVRVTRPATET